MLGYLLNECMTERMYRQQLNWSQQVKGRSEWSTKWKNAQTNELMTNSTHVQASVNSPHVTSKLQLSVYEYKNHKLYASIENMFHITQLEHRWLCQMQNRARHGTARQCPTRHSSLWNLGHLTTLFLLLHRPKSRHSSYAPTLCVTAWDAFWMQESRFGCEARKLCSEAKLGSSTVP